MRFIDEHKDRRVDGGLRWGVEPICTVLSEHSLPIALATYYAAKSRAPSARTVRDAELKPVIEQLHKDNYGVYACASCTPRCAEKGSTSAGTRPGG